MCTVPVEHLCLRLHMCFLPLQQYLDNIFAQMPDFLRSGSMQMARCCNHRCHKQGQTGSQHLSSSLSSWKTLRGTKWSATPNKSMRYRVAAGVNLSALGLSRILSLLLAGSKSNKQEDKWRVGRKKGRENRNKEEQHLKSGGQIRSGLVWLKKKKLENHHLWVTAAEFGSWCPSLSLPILRLSTFPTCNDSPSASDYLFPFESSLSLPLVPPSKSPFFKLVPSLPSNSPWSPLTLQLFPPRNTLIYTHARMA